MAGDSIANRTTSLEMKKQFLMSLALVLAPVVATAQKDIDTDKARIDALIQQMHDAATWGLPTTNGIQLGVAISKGSGTNQFRVFTYLYDETNFWIGLYPPSGHRLSLSLKDAGGKEFEKKKEGKAISKPVGLLDWSALKLRSSRIQGGFDLLAQKNVERYESPFNIFDCFNVQSPGTNTLTVGATLYKKSNDGNIYEVVLPAVSLPVPITQTDIDDYRALKKNAK